MSRHPFSAHKAFENARSNLAVLATLDPIHAESTCIQLRDSLLVNEERFELHRNNVEGGILARDKKKLR